MGSFYIGTPFLGQKVTELETALTAANAAIAANAGDTATLQTWASDRVKYAYPNGGSAGDERAVSNNAIYQVDSPFPAGVKFSTLAEFKANAQSEWVEFNNIIYSDNSLGGFGVRANSRSESALVVLTTGGTSLSTNARDGGPWSGPVLSGSVWRVRCARED